MYTAVWVSLLTFAVLAVHPLPWCFDCDFDPWGHGDVVYVWDSTLLGVWLIVASFAAGALNLKWRWVVPVGIVAAHLATQTIGGASLASLFHNEGPLILVLGLPVGLASLMLGDLARFALKRPV